MKISAIIITFNEERNLRECLRSVEWADEIVVVDSGSTDRTAGIAAGFPGVKFHVEPWRGFSAQKNHALDLAEGPWIFSIDADERVTPELAAEISGLDLDPSCITGYRVPRRNFFGNRWVRHGGWYPDYTIRLWRKETGCFEERAVHESVRVSGKVGTLSGDLIHYTYKDTVDFIERMNRYSSLGAQELLRRGKRPSVLDLLIRPPFTFFKMLVLKRGFLDGGLGLRLAVLYSMYTFLKYSMLRELWGQAGTGGTEPGSGGEGERAG